MPTILDKIVATKRVEIELAKLERPEGELKARIADTPSVKDFFAALAADGPIKLIAEVKKASPSAGLIRADFDPVAIAKVYAAHGAKCISVLTDEPHFQGASIIWRRFGPPSKSRCCERTLFSIPISLSRHALPGRTQCY